MKKIEVRPEKVRAMGNLIPPLSISDFELSDCMIHEENEYKINGHFFNHFSINVPTTPVNLVLGADYSSIYPDETSPSVATITATITDSAGTPVPNLDVYFQEEGSRIGTASTNDSGVATFEYSSSTGGVHLIRAYTTKQQQYEKSSAEININVFMPTTLTLSPASVTAKTVDTFTLTSKIVDQTSLPLANKLIELYKGDSKLKSAYSNNKGIVEFDIKYSELLKKIATLTATVDEDTVETGVSVTYNGTLTYNGTALNGITIKTSDGTTVATTDTNGAWTYTTSYTTTGTKSTIFVADVDSSIYETCKSSAVVVTVTQGKQDTVFLLSKVKTTYHVGDTITVTGVLRTSAGVGVSGASIYIGSTKVATTGSGGRFTYSTTASTTSFSGFTLTYPGDNNYKTSSRGVSFTVLEYNNPTMELSSDGLIGETGDTLAFYLYTEGDIDEGETVYLVDSDTGTVYDTVKVDVYNDANFNYTCTGAGDVNVKVKYIRGTNTFNSNIQSIEDCVFYDPMTSDTGKWSNPSNASITIDATGTTITASTSSEKSYILNTPLTEPYTAEITWIKGSSIQVFAMSNYEADTQNNSWYSCSYNYNSLLQVVCNGVQKDYNYVLKTGDVLKYEITEEFVKLYVNNELVLTNTSVVTKFPVNYRFYTNYGRSQTVKDFKIKPYSEV